MDTVTKFLVHVTPRWKAKVQRDYSKARYSVSLYKAICTTTLAFIGLHDASVGCLSTPDIVPISIKLTEPTIN